MTPGSPTLSSGMVAFLALAVAPSPVSPWPSALVDILCTVRAGPRQCCAMTLLRDPKGFPPLFTALEACLPGRLTTSDLPWAGPLQSLCVMLVGGGDAGQAGQEGWGEWIFLCGLGSLSGRCCQSGGLEAGPEGGAVGPTGRGCPGGPCLSSC